MQDIVELERRIAAALERIGRGLDALAEPVAAMPADPEPETASEAGPDLPAAPLAELEAERATTARLREKLAEAQTREAALREGHEARLAALTHQLDVQGLELQRMRKTAAQLREELRRLHEAEAAARVDPALINRALLAELDALRATRLRELAELDELAAALDDHLTEAEHA